MKIKVGIGYDVHRFSTQGEDLHVVLGGCKISSNRSIIAHSDGDLVLHALTDALLGSIAAGDIGSYFPPSDPKWKGANSETFVKHALKLLKDKNGKLSNVDITIIGEHPKINPHRNEIQKSLAKIVELDVEDVSVKATTVEKLGSIGREEGIACQAIVCISLI
ncbi:MAG: 2-C-methyl-D-erythritol 2,4-cyclodiphosphate synthase [Rickettsiales bacterium]